MEIKAKLNYLGITPRKVRLVADLVRNMDVKQAETQLKFTPKRASAPLLKLLNSAIANAKTNFNLEKEALYIKKLIINEGPLFKRWRAESRGRAAPIIKRTSHVNLVLDVKPSFAEAVKAKEKTKEKPAITKAVADKRAVSVSSKVPSKAKKEEKKPKPKAPKKIVKGKSLKGLAKKMFRRKSF
jgi:large subunit ribosomal protein L22